MLPVGISFYTFQTLSYTIDVYNKKIEPERHWGKFAVFVSFFPQLVAGPIERAGNLIPQFYKKYYFDIDRVISGGKLILWGFFKKLVIADRLALVVNGVYNDPYNFGGITLVLATFLFAYQIYCDFSGYSDIAIGSAKVLGFDLMENFKRPYFSKSISEFWSRWHISLSSWFKDYLYIPLGGNRVKVSRMYFNIFIVFLVSGFWHGANWTFIIWGAMHGVYLISAQIFKQYRSKSIILSKKVKDNLVTDWFHIFITFCLVCFAWIFFRSNSISEATYIIKTIYIDFPHIFTDIFKIGQGANILNFNELGVAKSTVVTSLLFIVLLEIVQLFQENKKLKILFIKIYPPIRIFIYAIALVLIFVFGVFEESKFIYFQF